jgi:hypothetical protein
MSLLKPAVVEQAAAKVGIFGTQGSGKTTTAALFLIGLSKTYHNGAPVGFLDTENGSDFLIPIFEAEGVQLLVVKSRAFKDMREAEKEARAAGCCGFLVDSYTHPWQELCDTFKAKSRRKKLEFHHMDELKGLWRQWTDQFLNSPLHIFVNGRLGYEWGKDEEGELVKLGSKMKSESEAGYEPSLLIEMEGVRPANTVKGKQRSQIVHLAHVLKDRWRTLNGRTFEFKDITDYKQGDYKKVFEAFMPHWQMLAQSKGVQRAVDGNRTSESLMDDNGRTLAQQRAQQAEIHTEVIQNTLAQLWPGQDALSKATRLAVIEALAGIPSWAALTKKPVEKLEESAALMSFVKEQMKDRQPFETADGAAAFVVMCKEQRAEIQRQAEAAAVL